MTAPPIDACSPTTALLAGRSVVTFGGCNYLGLSQHPRVVGAAADAMARFGLSTTASRETTGNTRLHEDLEGLLAGFCGHPAGLLVPDGYIANLAAMQGLSALGFRHAVIDRRAHPSLRDAAGMAGMRLHEYGHADARDAARLLAACEGRAVVVTDSVFAADGTVAPARRIHASLRDGDRLLLDDCHGFAVLGRAGRGLADELDLSRDRLVVTTTLAKGLGCGGGVVMGERALVDAARAGSTAYICTTPTSPALAAAAIEAIGLVGEDPSLHERLRANTTRIRSLLAERFDVDPAHPIPIIAFVAGEADAMRIMHEEMLDRGVLAPLVAYPGGPAPVYFRLSVSAEHTEQQIELLAAAISASVRNGRTARIPG
jgi:7-keto-8-aminopelargonate synthetase-like enzyme